MTAKERFALGSLLAVMVAGHLVRIFALAPTASPGGLSLLAGFVPADPLAHRARSARVGRPLAAGERIDLNRASAEEIARLPRVGLDLAKSIVAERANGGFTDLADVDRVPRVGPGLLAAIGPFTTFGDTGRGRRGRQARAVWPPVPAPPVVLDTGRAAGRRGGSTGASAGRRIPLNSASQAELERLPGIGPTRAKAILAYRQSHGPFASVEELEKVPGIPRRLVVQLAAQVAVP